VAVGLLSLGMSLVLMSWQVRPESIGSVTTAQLLVTLALAALPWLTYAAWRFEFTTGPRGWMASGPTDRRVGPMDGREHLGERMARVDRRHRRAPTGRTNSSDSAGGGRI